MFQMIAYIVFFALCVAAAVADVKWLRIPNAITGAMLTTWALWVIASFMSSGMDGGFQVIIASVYGGVALLVGVCLVAFIYEAITKKTCIGGGDMKMIGLAGLFLGWESGAWALLIACIASIPVAFLYRKTKSGKRNIEEGKAFNSYPIPFALPIAIGVAPFALSVPLVSLFMYISLGTMAA